MNRHRFTIYGFAFGVVAVVDWVNIIGVTEPDTPLPVWFRALVAIAISLFLILLFEGKDGR